MSIGSGLGASFGAKAESTYGTYAAPDRFYAGRSYNLKKVQNTQPVSGVAAGRPAPPDEVVTTTAGTGRLELDVMRTGFGLLLAHAMGSTASPVQQAATAAYLQSHSLGDNRGLYLTLQKGVPDTGGTANPFTALGSKVTSLELACGVDELLQASLDFDCREITQDETLSAPSYTAGNLPFHFAEMDLKLGTYGAEASVEGVRKVTVTIARSQDTGRFYGGNSGLKSEPIWNEFAAVSGSIEVDLVTKADFVDRFLNHDDVALDWVFTGPEIATGEPYLFRLRCPKVYFGGDIPEVTGPDVNRATIPFTAFYDTTNGLVAAEYQSTDSSV